MQTSGSGRSPREAGEAEVWLLTEQAILTRDGSPLTESEFTYVRSVRELGAGTAPLLLLFFLIKPLRAAETRSVLHWVSVSNGTLWSFFPAGERLRSNC